jgi:hypothetical protein
MSPDERQGRLTESPEMLWYRAFREFQPFFIQVVRTFGKSCFRGDFLVKFAFVSVWLSTAVRTEAFVAKMVSLVPVFEKVPNATENRSALPVQSDRSSR